MNIIEKLGLNTPDELITVVDVWKVYDLAGLTRPNTQGDFFENGRQLKKILDERNEMLEALTEVLDLIYLEDDQTIDEFVKIIEKATRKTWEEIKQLMEVTE